MATWKVRLFLFIRAVGAVGWILTLFGGLASLLFNATAALFNKPPMWLLESFVVFMVGCLVLVIISIFEPDPGSIMRKAINWKRITSRPYEQFPREPAMREWMVRTQWATKHHLIPAAETANESFWFRENREKDLAHAIAELKKVGKSEFCNVSGPEGFQEWRAGRADTLKEKKDSVSVAQDFLRTAEGRAATDTKLFHEKWDYFNDLLGTTPIDPRTGKPFEGKDAPKQFLDRVRETYHGTGAITSPVPASDALPQFEPTPPRII